MKHWNVRTGRIRVGLYCRCWFMRTTLYASSHIATRISAVADIPPDAICTSVSQCHYMYTQQSLTWNVCRSRSRSLNTVAVTRLTVIWQQTGETISNTSHRCLIAFSLDYYYENLYCRGYKNHINNIMCYIYILRRIVFVTNNGLCPLFCLAQYQQHHPHRRHQLQEQRPPQVSFFKLQHL